MSTSATVIAAAATVASDVLLASKDVSHPKHHFSLGQVLATLVLGAEDAFAAYKSPDHIPDAINEFVSGFVAIWLAKPAAAPSVPAEANPSNQ